ncbi:nuclear transport factor 2 family protein [Streptomyces sp. AC512_CC834]|uniref:nuclear transport factor 2 family protein n=1 Tax=Streptomyces sp. AC512_CC834 TaxID=2823691 RepID=UPI0027E5526E|nr:nuclear transport factor 2 family protein [Streptomyces sp. AC512_CC834]
MKRLEPAAIVREFWARMQARDWKGLGALLAEDLVVEWPASAERIVGRADFVSVNAEYPEGWSIHVIRIVADGGDGDGDGDGDGETVVSEVEVPHDTMGVHRVVSLWTVRDGRITGGREYWTELGSDPSPEWRAAFVRPL